MVCWAMSAIGRLAAVHAVVLEPPLWGVAFHSDLRPGEAAQMAAAFSIARIDATWADVETQIGIYNFSRYQRIGEQLSESGIIPLYILDYGNPLHTGDAGTPPLTAKAIAAFSAYAVEAVRALGGYNNAFFELWNEPNVPMFWDFSLKSTSKQYAALAKGVQVAFAAAGVSSDRLVGPASMGVNPASAAFLRHVCEAGGLEGFSAATVHPYGFQGQPEDRLDHMRSIQGDLSACGGPAELWSSEWGYSTCKVPCKEVGVPAPFAMADLPKQARYLARMWLGNALVGVRTSVWYEYRDSDPAAIEGPPADEESHFGTVETEYLNETLPHLPKPSYLAARTLQQTFGLRQWVVSGPASHVSGPNDLYTVVFTRLKDNAKGYAAWRGCGNECGSMFASFSANGCFTVMTMYGHILDAHICAADDGRVTLEVSEEPRYLLSVAHIFNFVGSILI